MNKNSRKRSNELIDIKDIRLLVELLRKANPSYLEILFSKYVVAFNKDGEELAPEEGREGKQNKIHKQSFYHLQDFPLLVCLQQERLLG